MSKTILLADDSVTIQKVIELTFMDQDCSVVSVSSGDEALNRLGTMRPDLVIADVHMPGASGFEVARQSKARLPGVPVLLLVGTFEPFDEAEFAASGADQYLKKPFDSQELLRLVDSLGQPAAPAASGPSLAAPALGAVPAAFEAELDDTGSAFRLSLEDEDPLGSFGGPASSQVQPPDAFTFDAPELPPLPEPLAFEDATFEDATAEDLAVMAMDELPAVGLSADSGALSFELDEEPALAAPAPLLPLEPMDLSPAGELSVGFEAEEDLYAFERPDGLIYDVDRPEEDTAGLAAGMVDLEATDGDATGGVEADTGEFEILSAEALPLAEEGEVVAFAEPTFAEPAVAEPAAAAPAPVAAPAAGNGQAVSRLSDEDVERIAVRVAELVGDKVARELAWEILPDLAEVVIKERLRELESQVS